MEIKVRALKRCTWVALAGEVGHATAPELEQELLGLIKAGNGNLVISLRDVTYISSAGLKALVAAQIQTRRTTPPGNIVFAELSPTSRKTFELVGFDCLFAFYETDAEAVGSF